MHPHDHDLPLATVVVDASAITKRSALLRQTSSTTSGNKLAERIPGSFEKVSVSLSEGDPSAYYDLQKELARGQFSVICSGIDRKTFGIVAAKFIDSSSPDALNEYETLRSLKHERISELYRAFRFKNEYMVLIMEKLDNIDILTYL